MSRFTLLTTKKLSVALAAHVKENGIELIEREFIHVLSSVTEDVRNKISSLADQNACIVFTSSAAVEAIAGIATGVKWKVFCIEGKTQEAVTKNFEETEIIDTAGNAAALANKIAGNGTTEVTFFCGNQRRDELPLILKNKGVKAEELVVYNTIETPVEIKEDLDAVLFFSPSAVRSFFSCNQLIASTVCFAIGITTAEEIKGYSKNKIIVADAPSQEAMITNLIRYYKQPVQ